MITEPILAYSIRGYGGWSIDDWEIGDTDAASKKTKIGSVGQNCPILQGWRCRVPVAPVLRDAFYYRGIRVSERCGETDHIHGIEYSYDKLIFLRIRYPRLWLSL